MLSAQFIMSNQSTDRLGYNLCYMTLESQSGSDWLPVNWSPSWQCAADYQPLEIGHSFGQPHDLGISLPTGRYRFRMNVTWPFGGTPQPIVTNSFTIGF